MDSGSPDLPVVRSVWRDFLSMPVSPRVTMRRIMQHRPDRAVLPLLLASIVSAALTDDMSELGLTRGLDASVQLTVVGVAVAIVLLTIAAFFLFAWLLAAIARVLGGQADASSTRSALAWALVPSIWALLFHLPVALWGGAGPADLGPEGGVIIASPDLSSCGLAVMIALVELVVFVWTVALAVANLSVVAHLSRRMAALAIFLCLVAPVALLIVSLPLIE